MNSGMHATRRNQVLGPEEDRYNAIRVEARENNEDCGHCRVVRDASYCELKEMDLGRLGCVLCHFL